MGNYVNRFLTHNDDCDRKVKVDSSNETTSSNSNEATVHTPQMRHRKLVTDPRSVTAEICRTPIETQGTPGLTKRMASAIPKYLQRKPYLETDIDVVMPPLTPNKSMDPRSPNSVFPRTPILIDTLDQCVLSENNIKNCSKIMTSIEKDQFNIFTLDPRSPAADFDRTPILNIRPLKSLRTRSQENLCRRASYDTDMYRPRFSYCETIVPFEVPEIQTVPELGFGGDKCQIADMINDSNELNDSPLSYTSSSASIETISQSSDDEVTVIYQKLQDEPRKCEKVWGIFDTNEQRPRLGTRTNIKCERDSERTHKDKIKIWRDSLSSEESREIDAAASVDDEFDGKRAAQIRKEDIIITFDDDTVIKNSFASKVGMSDNESNKKTDTLGRKKKVAKGENDITTVDRKKLLSPGTTSGNEVQKCRTPLGNRSNNGHKQELSTKSPQHVLRSKAMSVKRYQENTPPHKAGTVKSRINGIQWDPDSTVII